MPAFVIRLGHAQWGVGYTFGATVKCGISFSPITEGATIDDPVRDRLQDQHDLVISFANLESLAVLEDACAKARAVLEGKTTNAELLAAYNKLCDLHEGKS